MRFCYIIKNEGRRAAFSDTIALSQEVCGPGRWGAWCVNNGIMVPTLSAGVEAGGGLLRAVGSPHRVWGGNPPVPPNKALALLVQPERRPTDLLGRRMEDESGGPPPGRPCPPWPG